MEDGEGKENAASSAEVIRPRRSGTTYASAAPAGAPVALPSGVTTPSEVSQDKGDNTFTFG